MLDEAFAALMKMDWGTDLAPLAPIDDAVAATNGNVEARRDLENRLIAVLSSDASRDAKDYACRKLATVGTAASVPALAVLAVEKNHAHMARFALERIPDPAAAEALRQALPQVDGDVKIGLIASLGSRRDAASVAALGKLSADGNTAIARAAALALGTIGNAAAAAALQQAAAGASTTKPAVLDALLACAEALLAGNQLAEATAIYRSLAGDDQARLVRLAATRGLLACAAKQS